MNGRRKGTLSGFIGVPQSLTKIPQSSSGVNTNRSNTKYSSLWSDIVFMGLSLGESEKEREYSQHKHQLSHRRYFPVRCRESRMLFWEFSFLCFFKMNSHLRNSSIFSSSSSSARSWLIPEFLKQILPVILIFFGTLNNCRTDDTVDLVISHCSFQWTKSLNYVRMSKSFHVTTKNCH